MEFLEFFENSGLAIWLRESPSILAYPTLLAFHTFGMAFLVGTSAAIALRLLGVASGVPLAPLKKFFVVIWVGSALSLASGLLLLMLDAVLFLTMPVFYIKLAAIVMALVIMRLIRARMFGDPGAATKELVQREGQILAGAVLICWVIAITAGRVTAYSPSIGWQSAGAVLVLAGVLAVGRHVALRFFWGAKTPTSESPHGNIDPLLRR